MCQWHPSFSFCTAWRRTKHLGMQSRGELPLGKISFPNAFPFFLREGSNAATSLQAPGTQRLQLLFSGAQGTPKCMYCHTHRSEIMQFSNRSKQLIIRGGKMLGCAGCWLCDGCSSRLRADSAQGRERRLCCARGHAAFQKTRLAANSRARCHSGEQQDLRGWWQQNRDHADRSSAHDGLACCSGWL